MKNDIREVRRILGDLDPARELPQQRTASQLKSEASAVLAKAKASTALPLDPGGSRRLRYAAVAGVAAALVVVALVLGHLVKTPSAPSLAATPQLLAYTQDGQPDSASALLNLIADAAERSAPLPGSGPYDHVVADAWYLNSQVSGGRTTSAIVPQHRAFWWADDGSARIVSTNRPPEGPPSGDPGAWASEGAPGYSTESTVMDFAPGEYVGTFNGRPPTSVDALRVWLARSPPGEPEGTVDAIRDLLLTRALTPMERGAVLRVLAELPGVYYSGSAVDRTGRPGKAFSINSDASGLPTQTTFVVDEATGQILDAEKVLTETAGKLNVQIPAVVSYEVFLRAEKVASRYDS